MKSFAIVVGILGLVAGYANAAAVATNQVLATRGEQVADTSIFKNGEPRLVQERDYAAPMLEETEDKLARSLDLTPREVLWELPYNKNMFGMMGKAITCMYKCNEAHRRKLLDIKFRYV
ncbi:hypothetical protein VE03_00383 [Pseudogymnoascus sp. 23342-1-I1]|nr:hypothetical protein VE03_00383 [Pseudogymnoascus sp. 23342-1-I1]